MTLSSASMNNGNVLPDLSMKSVIAVKMAVNF